MRYLFLTLCLLFIAPSSFAQIFGYDTVGITFGTFNDYSVVLMPMRLSPPQGGAIRIDSVLVYARSAISAVKGYLKGVVYNYNAVPAECSLQVVSDDSVLVDSDTPKWWNLPMPSDTLRACREYMVGFQAKNHDGAAQLRVFLDDGSAGDKWFVGDSDFDPPTSLAGATTTLADLNSVKAYYTVVSTDTLVVVDPEGADSTNWYDSYIYSGGPTSNFGTGIWMQHGVTSGDDFYTLTKYTSMSSIVPSGKKCDSAWLAFKIFTIEGASKTDSLWFDVRRVLPFWQEADVTWNKRLSLDNWTTAGALSEGNDILATPEQADSVCRCVRQVGWSLTWDSVMCNVDDTLLFQLAPNTIDSMSSGDLGAYGWKVQFDLTRSSDVSQRVFTRNRSPFSDRPYMYIYCSDIPAAGGGQIIMISGGP